MDHGRTTRTESLWINRPHVWTNTWEYAEGLDLAALYEPIRSVEGRAGRDTIDPKILPALWLYATLDGAGSAREVDRLCREHVAYRWICGVVSVNYRTLSDFRGGHTAFLDELLTQSGRRTRWEGGRSGRGKLAGEARQGRT